MHTCLLRIVRHCNRCLSNYPINDTLNKNEILEQLTMLCIFQRCNTFFKTISGRITRSWIIIPLKHHHGMLKLKWSLKMLNVIRHSLSMHLVTALIADTMADRNSWVPTITCIENFLYIILYQWHWIFICKIIVSMFWLLWNILDKSMIDAFDF